MLSSEGRRRSSGNPEILYGFMWKLILADCLRRGISQREVARRLGIGWRTFLRWKNAETREVVPLCIDTLARL